MERVQSKDGTLIAYVRYGNGPALVLVHGTTADHNRWQPVLFQLKERYTVYALDRRGRGESEDHLPYSIEREFEDIAAVVDSIGMPVNLLGHSYGAICSLEAARLTKNINRLVLYEPPISFGIDGFYPPVVIDTIRLQLKAGDHAAVVETFLREIPRVPLNELSLMKELPSWPRRVSTAHTILREIQASNTGYRFDPANFRDMITPTLLLLGSDSPDFFRTAIYRLHEALPDNTVAVMPGQQHVAIDAAPELFLGYVFNFLDQV